MRKGLLFALLLMLVFSPLVLSATLVEISPYFKQTTSQGTQIFESSDSINWNYTKPNYAVFEFFNSVLNSKIFSITVTELQPAGIESLVGKTKFGFKIKRLVGTPAEETCSGYYYIGLPFFGRSFPTCVVEFENSDRLEFEWSMEVRGSFWWSENFIKIKNWKIAFKKDSVASAISPEAPSETSTTSGVFAYVNGKIDTSENADTIAEIKQKIQSFPNALAVPNSEEGLNWQEFKITQYSGEGASEISKQIMVEQSNPATQSIAVSFTAILKFEKNSEELDCDSLVLNTASEARRQDIARPPLYTTCKLDGKQVLKATIVGIDDFSFNGDYASPQFTVSGNAKVFLLLEQPKELQFTKVIYNGSEEKIANNKVDFENPKEFKLQLENVSTSHTLYLVPKYDCSELKRVLKANATSDGQPITSDADFYYKLGQKFGQNLRIFGGSISNLTKGVYAGVKGFTQGTVSGVTEGVSLLDFGTIPTSESSGLVVLSGDYSHIIVQDSQVSRVMLDSEAVSKLGEKFLWKISKFNGKEIAQSELNSEQEKQLTLYACQYTSPTEIKQAKVTITFKKVSACNSMLECFARIGWRFATDLFGTSGS